MYPEDQLLPLSALQHLVFCERQCALIHVEQLWDNNRFTIEGDILHEHVHEAGTETRRNVRIERGVPLRSIRLGLVGVADIVEFEHGPDGRVVGASIIEYKRGKPKLHRADEVQVCAQAMCIEEMLGINMVLSQLFYGETRRRADVVLDAGLRAITEAAATRVHELINAGRTPPAQYGKHCRSCSLVNLCMPRQLAHARSAQAYLHDALTAGNMA